MVLSLDPTTSVHDVVYTAFDFETTGVKHTIDQIVEIGAVRFTTSGVLSEFSTLIKPTIVISDEVINIHNITNEMVQDAPAIKDKIGEFSQFLKDSVLMAHNISFDFRFLNNALTSCNMPIIENIPLIDTYQVAKKTGPKHPNHRLQTLAEYYKIARNDKHRALEDSHTCRKVFLKCIQELFILGDLEISKILV